MPSMCIWRADLDAMVRAEFSSIFPPAELAVYRDSVGVDDLRGKVHSILSPL